MKIAVRWPIETWSAPIPRMQSNAAVCTRRPRCCCRSSWWSDIPKQHGLGEVSATAAFLAVRCHAQRGERRHAHAQMSALTHTVATAHSVIVASSAATSGDAMLCHEAPAEKCRTDFAASAPEWPSPRS